MGVLNVTKYAVFDGNGLPLEFYAEDIHGARMRPVYGDADENGLSPVTGEESNPDCLIPADAVAITDEQWMEFIQFPGTRLWSGNGVIPYDPPPPPVTVQDYSVAIQALLEAKARERHYDSVQSAVSYRDDANEQFAAEAAALFAWRSAVWTYATAELEKVTAGERTQPGIKEFIGELPAFIWP